MFIDQGGARGRPGMKMKNRGDVTEGRKGKWRQRQALIARLTNKTAALYEQGYEDDTQRSGKMMQPVFQG